MRTTSQLSRLSGVSKRTLQYWSQGRSQNAKGQEVGGAGILPSEVNPENGYRVFSDDALAKVLMIRLAKESGCMQPEIQDMMDALNAGAIASMERRIAALLAQREEIDRKIRTTRALVLIQEEYAEQHSSSSSQSPNTPQDKTEASKQEVISELMGLALGELLDCFAREAPDVSPEIFARALRSWLSGGYAAMLLELCLGEGIVEKALDATECADGISLK